MQDFYGKATAALLASVCGHVAVLYWIAHAVGGVRWEKAAGAPGIPGPFTEVTVWTPGGIHFAPSRSTAHFKEASKPEVGDRSAEPGFSPRGGGAAPAIGSSAAGSFGARGTSRSYRALLHSFLDQSKSYPASLRELALEGSVRVRFRVTREGRLADISVPEQEIPGLLRAEALKFLKRLRSVPVPPEEATEAELHFELPLRYEARRGPG